MHFPLKDTHKDTTNSLEPWSGFCRPARLGGSIHHGSRAQSEHSLLDERERSAEGRQRHWTQFDFPCHFRSVAKGVKTGVILRFGSNTPRTWRLEEWGGDGQWANVMGVQPPFKHRGGR